MNKDKLWEITDMLDDLHMDALVLEGLTTILWNSMQNGDVLESNRFHNNAAYHIDKMAMKLQRDMSNIVELLHAYMKESKKPQ